jgi:predicted metal-binding protein
LCHGEWRCLKEASLGDGNFEEPCKVVAFSRCECPGRKIASNIMMAIKLSEIKPDVIYLSSCCAKAMPGCPYTDPEEKAKILEDKTGIKVVIGTHDYH